MILWAASLGFACWGLLSQRSHELVRCEETYKQGWQSDDRSVKASSVADKRVKCVLWASVDVSCVAKLDQQSTRRRCSLLIGITRRPSSLYDWELYLRWKSRRLELWVTCPQMKCHEVCICDINLENAVLAVIILVWVWWQSDSLLFSGRTLQLHWKHRNSILKSRSEVFHVELLVL